MIAEFENYLRTQTDLSEADIKHMGQPAVSRKLRRGEFLFHAGDVCRHKVFVCTGMLRMFGTTADGNEHILQFSPEFNWTVDPESYDRNVPSLYNIDAVEASEVLLWAKADFDRLLADIPALRRYAEQLISRVGYSGRQRLLTVLSATPEQKYEDFVRTFPELLPRLPLRMIAAYLGISLKTLNRVRQAQLQRF